LCGNADLSGTGVGGDAGGWKSGDCIGRLRHVSGVTG